MQTRKEYFENQPFRAKWKKVLVDVENISSPPSATANNIQNLARLKKSVVYVDQLISASDLDLVPISVWSNFEGPVSKLLADISSLGSNYLEASLDSANSQVDMLLQYLAPHVVTGKGAAQAAGRALSKYSKQIAEHTESIELKTINTLNLSEESLVRAEKTLQELEGIKRKIQDYDAELFTGKADGELSVQARVSEFSKQIKSSRDSIVAYYAELLGDENTSNSIQENIQSASDSVETIKQSAKENLSEMESILDQLEDVYHKVFGVISEEGVREGGLQEEYEDQKSNWKEACEAQAQRLETHDKEQRRKHAALINEVEGLLPGAIGSGLASSFAEQRKAYSKPITWFGRLFYFSIVLLLIIGVSTLFSFSKDVGLTISWPDDWKKLLVASVARAPIALPLVWLAFFAAKRRNENRRLEEEYAHKETIARSFYSFKKQIEELGEKASSDLSLKLLEAAISSVAFNASTTLDKDHTEVLPNAEQLSELYSVVKTVKAIKEIS